MKTLLEMIQEAQGGEFQQNVAKQFGLDSSQAEQAMEALMPAFSRGLKQNAADPMGFAKFMGAVSSGKHMQYENSMEKAFASDGMNEGNAILSHLFGSKDVSRAVAANAAQVTGIGESVLKQMLPALAPVIMGALFKNMSAQSQTSQFGGMGNNPLGQIFEQMTGAQKRGGGNPLEDLFGQVMGGAKGSNNPLGDLLGQMMGGAQQPQTQRTPRAPEEKSPLEDIFGRYSGPRESEGQPTSGIPGLDDSPLGKIFGEMMRGGVPGAGGSAAQQPQNAPREDYRDQNQAERPTGGGLGDLFGDMFESGRTVQREYQRNVDDIFDQYLDGMKRGR